MISIVQDLYQSYLDNIPYRDVNTKDWLLLHDTPVYVWLFSVAYLLLVAMGPRMMRDRPPFELMNFMRCYNFGLVVLSVYMVVEMVWSTWDAGYSCWCTPLGSTEDPKEMRVARVMWWYFFSKLLELMDTVLMVLRKKGGQITFLHVFHHLTMLNIWWWVMMFIPGGESFFGALLNTIVHVVMYSYYFLSSFPSLRRHLWWKRYLTQFQLTQFCIIFAHSVKTLVVGCAFPLWGTQLLVGYTVILFSLFGNFYLQSYFKKAAGVDAHRSGDGPAKNGYSNGVLNNNAKKKLS